MKQAALKVRASIGSAPASRSASSIIDFGRGLCFYITLHEPIKVTLWFNFQPLTPIIQQVVGNRIVITACAVYRAEYSN
ncbi:MAG TPA: hypothetical protein VMW11_09270 [Candidatus Dormibacteraeota bacterium]|nr:hypothetical protein [Candidatus Dormibacteraeota bacterium]